MDSLPGRMPQGSHRGVKRLKEHLISAPEAWTGLSGPWEVVCTSDPMLRGMLFVRRVAAGSTATPATGRSGPGPRQLVEPVWKSFLTIGKFLLSGFCQPSSAVAGDLWPAFCPSLGTLSILRPGY